MNDLIDGCRIEGRIELEGNNIFDKGVDITNLRRRVGMVFQKPNPFPKSIYENVAYGLRLQGVNNKRVLDDVVEASLRGAALWNEAKDDCTIRRWACPAASSNGCVSPVPLPCSPRCCCSMSRVRRWTRFPR
jgi:ABC-type phosphate transport system ATPase subunit